MQKYLVGVVTMLSVGSLAGQAFGQDRVSLYAPGRSIKDQSISLSAWGSGDVKEAEEFALQGTTSIRINTRNYFQGGVIQFANPIDLNSAFKDPDALLEITYQIPGSDTVLNPKSPNKKPTQGGSKNSKFDFQRKRALNVVGVGMEIGQGGRGGFGGGRGGQGGARQGTGRNQPGALPTPAVVEQVPVTEFRLVVTTTDGLKSELYLPIASSVAASVQGWKNTAFPLNAVLGFSRTNKIVQSIAISADSDATIYVGSMRIVSDTTPISLELPYQDLNLAQGDQVELVALGYAGATLLKYEWDFDQSDGIQVDAEGPSVTRTFTKPGTYIITVTAKDGYGQKAPVSKTMKVVVNP